MEALIQYFAKEGRSIVQAPAVFGIALVLCVGIAWAVIQWAYGSRFDGQAATISSLESRLRLKDDQLADYKNKLNGATPEDARKRIDALELLVRDLRPRRLTLEQKKVLVDLMSGLSGSVRIESDAAVSDARALASDLATGFQAAGWHVEMPMVMGLSNPPPTGIGVLVNSVTKDDVVEERVKNALSKMGLIFDFRRGTIRSHFQNSTSGINAHSNEPDTDIEIIVTVKTA